MLNLDLALSCIGAAVERLGAVLYGRAIPLMVGLTRRAKGTTITLASSDGDELNTEPVERYGIKVMSTQFLLAEDQALAWQGPLTNLLLGRLATSIRWGRLDHLIVDLPPGTGDVHHRRAALLRDATASVV